MFKGVAPAVRKEFEKGLRARLPAFSRARKEEILWYDKPPMRTELTSEMFVYALKFAEDLWFFIDLQTASKSWNNWFCVELAWNDRPVYWSTTITDRILPPVYAAKNPKKVHERAKFRLRTYICGEVIDGWWLTPQKDPRPLKEIPVEEALSNVEPMVEDAINKTCTRGMEWFRLVAEKRGYDPNDQRLWA